jgi:hypothetical protein
MLSLTTFKLHYAIVHVTYQTVSMTVSGKLIMCVGVITQLTTLFAVKSPQPICHYNEDCPPHKLCDRLNRVCINPCLEDSCGENAQCLAVNHGIDCRCFDGYIGNPYVECTKGI